MLKWVRVLQPSHLRSCCAKYHGPLLRGTKQLQSPGTRYISSEGQQNNNGLNKEAGQTEDEADPECCLSEPAGPRRGLANEHQGTQETQLEWQEKQKTYFWVVGFDDRCWAEMVKDGSDNGCQDDTQHCKHDQDDAHGVIEGEEFFHPSHTLHLVLVWPVVLRTLCALSGTFLGHIRSTNMV